MRHKYFSFVIFFIIFLIDRLSKIFVPEKFSITENFISITNVHNTGAAFGILQNQTVFLLIFAILVILSLSVYVVKRGNELNLLQKFSFGLIMGGASGNLFDRAYYGYVIDFIKLEFINFPVFNMADIFINLGVILILIKIFISSKNKKTC